MSGTVVAAGAVFDEETTTKPELLVALRIDEIFTPKVTMRKEPSREAMAPDAVTLARDPPVQVKVVPAPVGVALKMYGRVG
jgi:hypothetical protein